VQPSNRRRHPALDALNMTLGMRRAKGVIDYSDPGSLFTIKHELSSEGR
jgi:hypothetical protein